LNIQTNVLMTNLNKLKTDLVSILSLFTSFSTLICCALPALLVTLGMGVVMAGLASDLPFLATMSQYKGWTFGVATVLIGLNFWLVYRKQNEVCEIGEDGKETSCDTASRWSKVILWISAVLLFIGFFMSYLALPIMQYLDNN
jgi:mercuric ion transport protein